MAELSSTSVFFLMVRTVEVLLGVRRDCGGRMVVGKEKKVP